MSEYLPRFTPGQNVTHTAAADLVGGQLVEITADRTVGPAAAGSLKVAGVVGNDCKAGGEVVVYMIPGHVHWVEAAAVVAAGDQIEAAADGKVTAGTTAPIGIALKAAEAGAVVEFLGR